jgi:uncharacterized protein YjbK
MKAWLKFITFVFSTSLMARTGATPNQTVAEYHYQICEAEVTKIKEKMVLLAGEISEEKKMKVYFFEDSQLSLHRQNFIIRLRLKENKAELTLKSRSAMTSRRVNEIGDCEWDVYRQSKMRSCSQKSEIKLLDAMDVIKHPEKITDLLSEKDLEFLKQYNIDLRRLDLLSLGPVNATKFEYENSFVYESWKFDEKTNLHEVSWRGYSSDLAGTYQKQLQKLKAVNLKICSSELKKTKFALDYFLNRNH